MPARRHFDRALVFLLLFAAALAARPTRAEKATSPGAEVKAQHLTVRLVPLRDSIQPGGDLDVGLTFHLDHGWHVYWVNAGDSGEPPAIHWTLPAGLTAGPMQYPAPKRLPLGPLMDFGYEDEVLFPIKLHADAALKPGAIHADAKVDWLVCREVCLPGKANLQLPIQVGTEQGKVDPAARALFDIYEARLPKPLPAGSSARFARTPTGLTLAVSGAPKGKPLFFPFDQGVIANPAPQDVKSAQNTLQIALKTDENLTKTPAQLHGLLVYDDGKAAYEIQAAPGAVAPVAAASAGFGSIVRIAALAFVGGLILNLMPCVFPVLFIKGLSLVQSSQEERRAMRVHGWVYTLGILVSFWVVVAILLALRAGGSQFGWGFQFQSPGFIASMALLLFFLGLSLSGMFELGLTLTSKGSGLAARQGYAGSFFTGVLAMVVATPCTAPFMGVAIGFALGQAALTTFLIFTAIALGLAAPYLLLAYNPAWTRLLPRPGAWMEVLKQATAVPIFATVIWLVWLFAQAVGANALIGLLGGFLLLAVAGWVLGRWPAKGTATVVAVAILACAVALPIWAARKFGETAVAAAGKASGSEWMPFTPDVVARLQAQGKPVFVDFTASWCLSCQVNERVVLNRSDVQQRLKESGVALVRADWTRHDESIAQALALLGRSGVPTYALYPANPGAAPQVLPEVLTPGIVIGALDGIGQQGSGKQPGS